MASEVKDESVTRQSDDENDDTSEEIKKVGDSKEEEKLKNETKEDSDDDEDDDDEEEEEEEEVALLDRPVEVTGCRARKKVERLDVSFSLPKVKQELPEGRGKKLGECPRIEMQIQKMKLPDLKPLHHICFNRMGSGNEIKKNIRKFSGFAFEKDSTEFNRKKAAIEKLTFPVLKNICTILDVKRNGTKEEVVNRILSFLWKPEDSEKKVSSQKTPKEKKKSSGKKVKSEKKTKHKSKDEAKEDIEEDDSSVSEGSEGGSDEELEEKPKKKSMASIRICKIEKSNEDKKPKGSKRVKDDSSGSSDDEPPTKKFKMPSDEEISKLVKQILESADLQEITMKKVIKQVSDAYPEFDLSHKKAFIKSTIKSVIS